MRSPDIDLPPTQKHLAPLNRRSAIFGMVASIACALTKASSGESPQPIDAERDPLERFGLDPEFRALLERAGCSEQWRQTCAKLEAVRVPSGERFENRVDTHVSRATPAMIKNVRTRLQQAGNEVSDDVDFSFGYRDEIPHIYASITQDHGKIDVLLRLVQDRTEHVNVNGKNEIVGQENFGMQHQSTSFGVELLDRQGKRLSVTTAHPNGIATFNVSRFPNAHPFSIRFCPASDIRPAQVKVPPSDAGFSYVDEKNI